MPLQTEHAELYDLLKSFYEITGIKTALYDTDLQEIFTYPAENCALCQQIQAQYHNRCSESNLKLFDECRACNGVAIRKCHAGLTEAACPLTTECGTVIGYIMYGQITNDPDRKHFGENIVQKLCEMPLIDRNAAAYSNKIRYFSDSQLQAISHIFTALNAYIQLKHLAYATEKPLLYAVMDYISAHLDKDLSVGTLCRKFGVSRAALYKLSKSYMPDGIAEFIKNARLTRAAELLKKSDEPVWRIAESVGFSDKDYFLRLFKKKYGIPAGKYRSSL